MESKDKKISQSDSARIQKVILELRDRPPKSKEELGLYLIKYYGVYLAKKAIDPENSSPLDFVWDVYSTAMGFNTGPDDCYSFLGMACRGGMKSLSCAVLEALLLTHDRYRDWFHMASVKEQSYVTYQYFRQFLSRKIMAGVASEPTMRETISKHGRQLKIGTATMDSVNCVAGDQLLHTDMGYFRVDELYKADKVAGKSTTYQNLNNPSYLKNNPITHVTYQGVAPTKIIRMLSGGEIRVTLNHNCLVVNLLNSDSGGISKQERKVKAKDVVVGDYFYRGNNFDSSMVLDRVEEILDAGECEVYDLFSPAENKISVNGFVTYQSFHGSLVQDELDLTPAHIFNESKGMLSAQHGRMPLNIAISSRKFAVGNIQTLLDKSKKEANFPLKIHRWGILEITEKCLPDRHGEYGQEIYVNEEDLIAVSPEEYENVAGMERSKYDKKIGYENCLSCGIFSFCQGRLPNQDGGNPHLQPINLTRTFFKTDSLDFFKSQRLNKKPSTEGLIYGAWDEDVHVKSYGQMWEIFHGEPHPDLVKNPTTGRPKRFDISLDELCSAFIAAGCRCVVGVDFGFAVLASCGLFFIDGSGRVYFVDELTYTQHSDSEVAAEIKRHWGHLPVDEVIADPESPSGQKEIQKATDWGIRKKVDKNVKEGIESVRRLLRLPGGRKTRFFASLNCTVFREEVKNYRNKIDSRTQEVLQEVDKRNDHSCDMVRYVIHTIFGGNQFDGNFNPKDQPSEMKDFNLNRVERAPTATELAGVVGTNFSDNRDQFHYDPETKSYKASEDKKDKGPDTGGNSGFSFSF